jgi:hypothetical protein
MTAVPIRPGREAFKPSVCVCAGGILGNPVWREEGDAVIRWLAHASMLHSRD